MKNGKRDLLHGVIWQQLLMFFFPIMVGSIFQQLYNTVDAMVVGNFVGKQALGAVGGSTGTIINLLVGFTVGLSSGATVIIAQYYGRREEEGVRKGVYSGMFLAISLGAVLMVLGVIGEYLGKAILILNKTPQFIVRESLNIPAEISQTAGGCSMEAESGSAEAEQEDQCKD